MSGKIYQKNWKYSILKPYVDYCCGSVYSRTMTRGIENIPRDGAVILAPNHSNTLMDALVVLKSNPGITVFGARADIFRKPFIARLLRFARIVPMVRVRDGLHNVVQNYKTMEEIVEVLENSIKFCMFSEGTHRMKHSMLPIRKGIFRIALAANEKFGAEKPVYVLPMGLEYGSYVRYKSSLVISYGNPINITEFVKEHDGCSEQELYRLLTEELRQRMSEVITYINDDGDYEAKWNLVHASSAHLSDPEEALYRNQASVRNIERILEDNPEKGRKLLQASLDFDRERDDAGIYYASFGNSPTRKSLAMKTINSILALPFFLFFAILSLPMWALSEYLCSRKLKDKAFSNTARFGVKVVLSPFVIAAWAAVFFTSLPLPMAILLTLMSFMAYSKYYEYLKYVRIMISDYRLFANKKLQNKFNDLKSMTD